MRSDDTTSLPRTLENCEHGISIPPPPLPRGRGAAHPPVLVCCCVCGEPKWRKASYAARGGKVYCSTACKAKGQSVVDERECAYCGKAFTPTAQQIKLGRGSTCSYECRGLSQRYPGTVHCTNCQTLMSYRSGVRARRLNIEPICRTCANGARSVNPRIRFEAQRELSDINGCRDWLGSKDSDGYGVFHVTHDWQVAASRYAYCVAANIPIESLNENQHVCHTCDNPGCTQNAGIDNYFVFDVPYIAYGHLFLADAKTNALDKIQKGRLGNGKMGF